MLQWIYQLLCFQIHIGQQWRNIESYPDQNHSAWKKKKEYKYKSPYYNLKLHLKNIQKFTIYDLLHEQQSLAIHIWHIRECFRILVFLVLHKRRATVSWNLDDFVIFTSICDKLQKAKHGVRELIPTACACAQTRTHTVNYLFVVYCSKAFLHSATPMY